MPKPVSRLFRGFAGAVILLANMAMLLWLGRLQLAAMALAGTLNGMGFPVQLQVTALDTHHLQLAHVHVGRGAQFDQISVDFSPTGLRQHRIGKIRVQGGEVGINLSDPQWGLGIDLSQFATDKDQPNGWQAETIRIQNLHTKVQDEVGQFATKVNGTIVGKDASIDLDHINGKIAAHDQTIEMHRAELHLRKKDQALQFTAEGRATIQPDHADEDWKMADSRWQASGNLTISADGAEGPITAQILASSIEHPALSIRTAQAGTTGMIRWSRNHGPAFDGQVTIQGNGIDLSRFGIVRQLVLQPDLADLLQPVLQRADRSQRDLRLDFQAPVQWQDNTLTSNGGATLDLGGVQTSLHAALQSIRLQMKPILLTVTGQGSAQMPGLAEADLGGFQLAAGPDDVDLHTKALQAKIAAAGRSLQLTSTEGHMIRRPTRLLWQGPVNVQWNGPLLDTDLSHAKLRGSFSLDMQPGQTGIRILHGPAHLRIGTLVSGEWRGQNIHAKIQGNSNPVLAMDLQQTRAQVEIPAFSGRLQKAQLSDFTIDVTGSAAHAQVQIPAEGNSEAQLDLGQTHLDVSGASHPHVTFDDLAIVAQQTDDAWHGTANLGAGQLTAIPMPVVATSRDAHFTFTLDGQGMQASGQSIQARLEPLPAYRLIMAPITTQMDLHMGDGRITGNGTNALARNGREIGQVSFTHILQSGTGTFHAGNAELAFRPGHLQPQHIMPGLTGLVANVSGKTAYDFHGTWDQQGLTDSGGWVRSNGINLDLMLGTITGISGEMQFASLLPLRTAQPANIHISRMDTGILLQDGTVQIALSDDGKVDIEKAYWPFAGGELFLQPMQWEVGNTDQKAILQVQNVDLLQLSGLLGMKNTSAEGKLNGALPVHMQGNKLFVEKARLAANPPGVLRYGGNIADSASQSAPQAKLAFDVLKDLHYDQLELSLDGEVTGRMEARLVVEGKNPDVLGGAPFLLHINTSAEFARLLRQASEGNRIAKTISTTLEQQHQQGRSKAAQ